MFFTKFNPVTCRKHLLVGLLDRERWTWFLPLLFPRLEKLSFEKWKINEVLIEMQIEFNSPIVATFGFSFFKLWNSLEISSFSFSFF